MDVIVAHFWIDRSGDDSEWRIRVEGAKGEAVQLRFPMSALQPVRQALDDFQKKNEARRSGRMN